MAGPWISLAAVAGATGSVRIGPMVTPLSRRRVHKVARETATLDLLSSGRLTLGVGLGASSHRADGHHRQSARRGAPPRRPHP